MTIGVGDLESATKGSGARYNSGKPKVDLLPLYMIFDSYGKSREGMDATELDALHILGGLSRFQRTHDKQHLRDLLVTHKEYWRSCAVVFEYGMHKYSAWNWSKGMQWSVPIGCAVRHILAILEDKNYIDDESNLPHIGHIMCNLVMLLMFVDTFQEGNDLPPVDFLYK